MVSPRTRTSLLFWSASALFFLSGGTGLAYQVVWFKRFSHVWGNSNLAMAAVVASFLTGLGLGAHLIGRVTDRIKNPLFWYGASEAAIGVLVLIFPLELKALTWVSSLLYPVLADLPILHSIVRFLLTFLVLGPICILMGGTLPLLLKHFVPPDSAPRESAGWLYAINTLGAATGCYLAGFHIVPSLGLLGTNIIVAVLNLAIGGLAMALDKAYPRVDYAPAPTPAADPRQKGRVQPVFAPSREGRSLPVLYTVVALTGFAALLLEMLWTRQLALILGGSTYAFTAMLALLLVGIGLGSLIYHVWLRKREDLGYVPAIIIAALAATTLLGKLFIPELSILVGLLKDMRGLQSWNAAICIAASTALEFLPAVAMGILFPIFVDMTKKRAEDAGKAIGTVYAWNTVGSILGATLTSLFFVPLLGGYGTMALALGIYLVAMILVSPFPRSAPQAIFVLVLIQVMCAVIYFTTWAHDPRATNMGMYMYGYSGHELHRYKQSYFKEGASSNVLVTSQNEHYSLRVNGKVDASSAGDMTMQLGLAYMPMFLVPEARDLVVIGFGSGTTSGACLLFPDVKLTCCEIEPGVFEASKFFAAVNHSPQNHQRTGRLRMVFDDGRSHLQGTSEQYDIILSEPSNPWIAGVSNLFTREFYQAAKKRLKPGGILAQWIQMYSFKPADYAMIVNTVVQSFDNYALIRISDGDTILLAADHPITGTSQSLDKAQALVDSNPKVRADLEKYFGGMTDVRSILMNHLLLDKEALLDLVAKEDDVEINTDLNMKLEFDAPLRLFGGDRRKQVMKSILGSARADWFHKAAADFGLKREHAPAIHAMSGLFDRTTQAPLVLEIVKLGLELDPNHPALLTDTIILSSKLEADQFAKLLDRLFDVSQAELNRLGVSLFQEGRHEQAALVFEKLVTVHRDSVTTWNNLAVAYEAAGKLEDAQKAFERALSVDPLSDFAKKSFAAFKEKHGSKQPPGPGVPPPREVAKDPVPQTDSAAGGGGNSVPDHDHDHEGHSHDSAPPTSTAPPLGAIEQSGAATP